MKNKETKSIFSSLENFSSIPPPELWDKIEAKLDKPKKKKRLAAWWWVAAGLMAGLSIPTLLYVNSNQGNALELNIKNNSNGVVLQKDLKENVNSNGNKIVKSNNSKADRLNESNNENETSEKTTIHSINTNSVVAKTATVISSVAINNSKYTSFKKEKQHQSISEETNESQSDAIVATNNTVTSNNYKVASANEKNNPSQKSEPISNTGMINQNTDFSEVNKNKSIAENTKFKDSLSSSIIKKEVAQLENALANLDKEKTKKKLSPEVIDKWSLQVFAGVMSSDNFTNEKSLGNTVASKQSGGYGVKTNYKLNKKWAVSSGFKINELGQKIDGVFYYERSNSYSVASGIFPFTSDNSLQNSPIKNDNIVFASTNENYLFASNSKATTGFETGNVTQNLKYFEMPLEVSYAVLSKKKANISLNTGGFVGKLISNDVLLNGNSIGENNNVNEFVYGTLLSSTLQYEVYKKTKFFIEPGMNYYINPLENQSFNQFQWMFNVGLNVSF
jgi:hypothetical protein